MTYLVPTTNRIAREIDGLFNSFFSFPSLKSEVCCNFTPRVNIKETDDNITLTFELPGMEKNDIKVLVKDDILTVSGERIFKSEQKDEGFVRREIGTGSFSRSFTLPDTVDGEKISADYRNGLLEVRLAKREEVKPKQIEVKVS